MNTQLFQRVDKLISTVWVHRKQLIYVIRKWYLEGCSPKWVSLDGGISADFYFAHYTPVYCLMFFFTQSTCNFYKSYNKVLIKFTF